MIQPRGDGINTMGEIGQIPLQQQSHLFGGTFLRRMRALKPGKVSCTTLYAMHLASGIPVDRQPGVCPVCGSSHCKLEQALEHRGC